MGTIFRQHPNILQQGVFLSKFVTTITVCSFCVMFPATWNRSAEKCKNNMFFDLFQFLRTLKFRQLEVAGLPPRHQTRIQMFMIQILMPSLMPMMQGSKIMNVSLHIHR